MTPRRGELSDRQWAQLAPLLPPERPTKPGHPWQPLRKVLTGILWRLRTGTTWRDIPARYGPWQTCYDRYVRWQHQGLWVHILQALQARADAADRLHWAKGSLDSTIVRAYQHAAGAPGGRGSSGEALGHGRGGLTTKIHLLCDDRERPLSLHLSAGQVSDSKHLGPTLARGRVPRPGRGRLRRISRFGMRQRLLTGVDICFVGLSYRVGSPEGESTAPAAPGQHAGGPARCPDRCAVRRPDAW